MLPLSVFSGALGIRGHTVLFVFISLLVSLAAGSAEGLESHLQLRLDLLKKSYSKLCSEFTNLAHNCSVPVPNCYECPDDKWLLVGDQCLLLETDRNGWLKSSKKCEEKGAHLAILTTTEQHEVVEKEGRMLSGFYTFYWMGLTDIEKEGEWKWVDNSTVKNTRWKVGSSEPDNNLSGGKEGEDCAVVDSHTQSWYDVPCSYLYPRICQMDAKLLK
ncbi:Collectin-12 Collectin placenta protein 1 [Collichthys lucidus]|uniref:Collectin-12 Collectin placenta protein 1 n=1 Tax=Collichthys lucidus TaxID=240159 RepID=A0A4U5V3F2_COLLU|nr:Collectin-12 Collectin placenta protein 1 [Collichthys lucidus]